MSTDYTDKQLATMYNLVLKDGWAVLNHQDRQVVARWARVKHGHMVKAAEFAQVEVDEMINPQPFAVLAEQPKKRKRGRPKNTDTQTNVKSETSTIPRETNGQPKPLQELSDAEKTAAADWAGVTFTRHEAGPEMVNHPEHYKLNSGVECFDIMQQIYGTDAVKTFCQLNAFKYQWRANRKDNQVEDLAKAQWYLAKFMELSKSGDSRA